MIEQITDHEAGGVARLTERYQKPRLQAWLASYLEQAQEFEDGVFPMLLLKSIDDSEGAQLDLIGRLVGQSRIGLEDDRYRVWLHTRIAANRSSGLPNELISMALQTFGSGSGVRLEEDYPAGFVLHLDNAINGVEGAEFATVLQLAKAAGVRAQLHWFGSEQEVFRYSASGDTEVDSSHGFSNSIYSGVSDGGQSAVWNAALAGEDVLVDEDDEVLIDEDGEQLVDA